MQPDSNVAIYPIGGGPAVGATQFWQGQRIRNHGLTERGLFYLTVQSTDCNMVVYSASGVAYWQSQSHGRGTDCYLEVNNSQPRLINSAGQQVWPR